MGFSIFPAASASASNPTNDFTVNVGTSGFTNISLGTNFAAGSYVCTSSLSDITLDIYLLASDGSNAGFANATTATTTVVATKAFNTVVIYGANNNDTLTFAFKYVFSPTNVGSNVGAAPRLISLTPSSLPNQNNTTTITGQNFATDVAITFTGSDNVVRSAKAITRNSATSLTVTRPDALPPTHSPYAVTAANPGISSPTSTNSHILSAAITSGSFLTWATSPTLDFAYFNTAFSQTLSATDADGGSSPAYAVVSGSFPTGISLASNGVISGTSTSTTFGTYTIIISATDAGGNVTNQTFTMTYASATGGTITASGSTVTHTFTSNASFVPLRSMSISYTTIGGGGGGGGGAGGGNGGGGGGGGAFAAVGTTTLSSSTGITVGGGGSAGAQNATGGSGTSTTFVANAAGGSPGAGTSDWTGARGGDGGSGGGGGGFGNQQGGRQSGGAGGSSGGGGTAAQGAGGNGNGGNNARGGGGGGGGGGMNQTGGGAAGTPGGGAGGASSYGWNSGSANAQQGFPANSAGGGGGGGGGGNQAGGSGTGGGAGGGGAVIITYS